MPQKHLNNLFCMSKEVDIREDLLGRKGCPVCNHIIQVISKFFAHWQYALANDELFRQDYAYEFGFCPFHTWQLASFSSPLGIALGFPTFLEHVAHILSSRAETSSIRMENILYVVGESATCSVCRLIERTQETYTHHLALFLENDDDRKTYARSHGVCLRHLRQLVDVSSDETVKFLLRDEAARLSRISSDLRNYASKWEALRRDLLTQDEEDAYRLALSKIAGKRNVFAYGQSRGSLG